MRCETYAPPSCVVYVKVGYHNALSDGITPSGLHIKATPDHDDHDDDDDYDMTLPPSRESILQATTGI